MTTISLEEQLSQDEIERILAFLPLSDFVHFCVTCKRYSHLLSDKCYMWRERTEMHKYKHAKKVVGMKNVKNRVRYSVAISSYLKKISETKPANQSQ